MAKNVTFARVDDGYNVKNKHKIQYSNLPCTVRPIPRGQASQFYCLQECWKQLKILSVRKFGMRAS